MSNVEAISNAGETADPVSTSVAIKLDYPVTVEGMYIDEVTMRRPKVRDRLIAEKASGGEVEKELRLLANLCELPPTYLEHFDMCDYVKLQECLARFLS